MNLESLDKQTEKLITTAWEECRWECGTLGYLTECPLKIIQGVTSTWIRNTIIFMINHDIGMEDSLQKLSVTREKDTSIMERFAQVTDDVTTLKKLNLCRHFLDVITISDITSTDGKSIC